MPEVKMPKTKKTAVIIICAGIAIPLALATALRAQEPGAAKGETPAPLPSSGRSRRQPRLALRAAQGRDHLVGPGLGRPHPAR